MRATSRSARRVPGRARGAARAAPRPRGLAAARWRGSSERAAQLRGAALARGRGALSCSAFGATLGASGYVSLRRAVAGEQQAQADALEARQRESQRSLTAAPGQGRTASAAFLAQLRRRESTSGCGRARPEERATASSASSPPGRSGPTCGAGSDMAQVAASLSYLDGRHGRAAGAHERAARLLPAGLGQAMKAARSALALAGSDCGRARHRRVGSGAAAAHPGAKPTPQEQPNPVARRPRDARSPARPRRRPCQPAPRRAAPGPRQEVGARLSPARLRARAGADAARAAGRRRGGLLPRAPGTRAGAGGASTSGAEGNLADRRREHRRQRRPRDLRASGARAAARPKPLGSRQSRRWTAWPRTCACGSRRLCRTRGATQRPKPSRRRRRRRKRRSGRGGGRPCLPVPPVAWGDCRAAALEVLVRGRQPREETREPEAVIADVRASLVETLLAADAATLAGLRRRRARHRRGATSVAGGLFVSERASEPHLAGERARPRRGGARGAARSAPRNCAGGSRSANTGGGESSTRVRTASVPSQAANSRYDEGDAFRKWSTRNVSGSEPLREHPGPPEIAAPRLGVRGGPEVAARERQREDAVEPRVDDRHGSGRAEEARQRLRRREHRHSEQQVVDARDERQGAQAHRGYTSPLPGHDPGCATAALLLGNTLLAAALLVALTAPVAIAAIRCRRCGTRRPRFRSFGSPSAATGSRSPCSHRDPRWTASPTRAWRSSSCPWEGPKDIEKTGAQRAVLAGLASAWSRRGRCRPRDLARAAARGIVGKEKGSAHAHDGVGRPGPRSPRRAARAWASAEKGVHLALGPEMCRARHRGRRAPANLPGLCAAVTRGTRRPREPETRPERRRNSEAARRRPESLEPRAEAEGRDRREAARRDSTCTAASGPELRGAARTAAARGAQHDDAGRTTGREGLLRRPRRGLDRTAGRERGLERSLPRRARHPAARGPDGTRRVAARAGPRGGLDAVTRRRTSPATASIARPGRAARPRRRGRSGSLGRLDRRARPGVVYQYALTAVDQAGNESPRRRPWRRACRERQARLRAIISKGRRERGYPKRQES